MIGRLREFVKLGCTGANNKRQTIFSKPGFAVFFVFLEKPFQGFGDVGDKHP